MSEEPKFKVLKTYMPLSELMKSVQDTDLIKNNIDFQTYVDILSNESVEDKIAVIQDRSLVNYRYISSFWVQTLNYMKANEHNPPMGVKIDKDEWMVAILHIKSCGDCEKALSKKCRCRQKIGNENNKKTP